MTLNAKLIGGAFALAMAVGSIAAPAMAATQTHTYSYNYQTNTRNCSIGETYNGGSIANEPSHDHKGDRGPNSACYNVGR